MPTLLFESVLPYTFCFRWLPDTPLVSKVEFKWHRLTGHLWRARELLGLLSGLREFRLLLERARTVAPPHPGLADIALDRRASYIFVTSSRKGLDGLGMAY